MNPNLIVDFDGTVVNDADRHWSVFEELTKSGISKEKYWTKRREGQTNYDIAAELFDKTPFNVEKFRNLIESKLFLEMDTLIPVENTLGRLASKYELTLCTVRTNTANCIWQLERLNVKDYFNKIVIIPHHELNRATGKASFLSRALTIGSNDTIIGDTEIDIATGKALSIHTVAVTSGIRSKQFLASKFPDRIISDINYFQ